MSKSANGKINLSDKMQLSPNERTAIQLLMHALKLIFVMNIDDTSLRRAIVIVEESQKQQLLKDGLDAKTLEEFDKRTREELNETYEIWKKQKPQKTSSVDPSDPSITAC